MPIITIITTIIIIKEEEEELYVVTACGFQTQVSDDRSAPSVGDGCSGSGRRRRCQNTFRTLLMCP